MYPPALSLLLVLGLSACHQGSHPTDQPLDRLSPKQALGRSLFFDRGLSTPAGQACADCHDPQHGFADPDSGQATSEGAIPGRFGSRNAPTAAYAAFSPDFHFDPDEGLFLGGQFLDGRARDLMAQARQPFFNPGEMNNQDALELVEKIRKAPYAEAFMALFGQQSLEDPDTALDRVAEAIAAFESSPEVMPFSSKFDAVLAGTATLTSQERLGLETFMRADKGNCAACHPASVGEEGTPPLFTDFSYDNLGVPRNPDNPFYTQSPAFNPDGAAFVDLGLGDNQVVLSPFENGKFKVPTLRNIAVTGPYMHNGVFTSLEEVVAFYNTRDIDPERWGPPEVGENVNRNELGNLGLDSTETSAIIAFLRTLSDGFQAP